LPRKICLGKVIFIHRDQRFVSINNTSFAASENALFSKNLTTNVVKLLPIFRTNDFHYTIAQQAKTLVGYENGLIIAINETDGTLLNIVDIINKQLPLI
jgi:hypothetical protein